MWTLGGVWKVQARPEVQKNDGESCDRMLHVESRRQGRPIECPLPNRKPRKDPMSDVYCFQWGLCYDTAGGEDKRLQLYWTA